MTLPHGAPTAFLLACLLVGVVAMLLAYRAKARGLYAASKAVASASFVAIAVLGGVPESLWGRLVLVGLATSAVGDVILAGRGALAFAGGLAAFTLAHAAFAAGFLLLAAAPTASSLTVPACLIAAVFAWRALQAHWSVPTGLRLPVASYLALLTVMIGLATLAASLHATLVLALGATLVAGSDLAVARHRFGRASFTNKLWGLPAYYVGQGLLALWLASV